MKKLFLYMLVLAGLIACGNEDIITNEQQPAAQTQVYHFSIPATIGDDAQTRAVSFDNSSNPPTCTSTFATTEKVYVYNKSKTTMLGSYLTPSNLSNENKNCDLTGDLTGEIELGDELWLLYNTGSDGRIYYASQNGEATGVKDGAKAVVNVSTTSPLTTSFAHFTNLQSIFRFKFEDESSTPISVASLTIFNTNNAVCRSYYGTSGGSELGKIYVNPSPATSDYLYVGIRFYSAAHDGNKMVFIASDGTKLYRARKVEPAAGFENEKYYYSTSPIQLINEGALQEPTITWTTPSSPVALYENDYCGLIVDNAEISLTGTSFGYRFLLTDYDTPATIHLNNLTATRFEEAFIESFYNSVTLDITGTNSITCDDAGRCVSALQNLKLKGTGTLTVTTNSTYECGLYGGSNYDSSNNSYSTTTTSVDVSTQLAADGYTVTRSARTDNGDGTYTWTYTVTAVSFTYNYTGAVQTFTAPVTGYYTLECYGAQGGAFSTNSGGYGGTSQLNYQLTQGEVLYIYVGGQGVDIENNKGHQDGGNGGWNGGGKGGTGVTRNGNHYSGGDGGGGATHIATSAIGEITSSTSFTDNHANLLLIAGGGGGGGGFGIGGSGGGATGGVGTHTWSSGEASWSIDWNNGTYSCGKDAMKSTNGAWSAEGCGGGGAGYQGGNTWTVTANASHQSFGGSGGSSWGDTTNGKGYTTTVGGATAGGNGKAVITWYGTTYPTE